MFTGVDSLDHSEVIYQPKTKLDAQIFMESIGLSVPALHIVDIDHIEITLAWIDSRKGAEIQIRSSASNEVGRYLPSSVGLSLENAKKELKLLIQEHKSNDLTFFLQALPENSSNRDIYSGQTMYDSANYTICIESIHDQATALARGNQTPDEVLIHRIGSEEITRDIASKEALKNNFLYTLLRYGRKEVSNVVKLKKLEETKREELDAPNKSEALVKYVKEWLQKSDNQDKINSLLGIKSKDNFQIESASVGRLLQIAGIKRLIESTDRLDPNKERLMKLLSNPNDPIFGYTIMDSSDLRLIANTTSKLFENGILQEGYMLKWSIINTSAGKKMVCWDIFKSNI